MRAGELRHRIRVEQLAKTQNEFGESVEAWTRFAEVWASREDLTGREAFMASQHAGEVTTQFTLRYIAGLNTAMRIESAGVLTTLPPFRMSKGGAVR